MSTQALQLGAEPTLEMSGAEAEYRTRLSELVRTRYSFVWRNLRRLGVPLSEIDDAAQEVFLTTGRRLSEITRGAENGFLFRTCEFVALRVRRRLAQRREVSEEALTHSADPRATPEQRALQSEAREELQQILDAMPDEYRSVFVLFEMEQLSFAEIAATLDLQLGTVSSRIFRARRFFERAVQRQGKQWQGKR
jgi:RNA polymerase sigma-70 factor (ECF subfamily)